MMRVVLRMFCSALLGVLFTALPPAAHALEIELTPTAHPSFTQAPRVGINLSARSYWGAEQFMNNVLQNPGFEGVIERSVIQVRSGQEHQFEDDAEWVGAPDGFWNNAGYEVITGPKKGLKGHIAKSVQRGPSGFPVYTTGESVAGLQPGDAIVVYRVHAPTKPYGWWVSKAHAHNIALVPTPPHPGGAGQHSLKIQTRLGTRAEINSYIDTTGRIAGRFLPVNGPWTFSIWIKAVAGSPRVSLQFGRAGQRFFQQDIEPTREWKEYKVDFNGKEHPTTDDENALQLTIASQGVGAEVLFDDVYLGPKSKSPFRSELVDTLNQLKPGYLRDWQGQLADSVHNRLAPPAQRLTVRHRSSDDGSYHYSLPEFVDLCAQIGANPWITLPATVLDEELPALAQFIVAAQKKHGFKRWGIEFGNENWNEIFRPGSISNPATHAARAEAVFQQLAPWLSTVPYTPVIGIQPANPQRYVNEARAAKNVNGVLAVAPYYFYEAQSNDDDRSVLKKIFPGDEASFLDTFKRLAAERPWLYEYNMHTTGGNAPTQMRNRWAASAMAGHALGARMVGLYQAGAVHQALYSLAQFNAFTDAPENGKKGSVALFGVMRDLAFPTFRPTALAMKLMNQTIAGDLYNLLCTSPSEGACSGVAAVAFKDQGQWRWALANRGDQPVRVTLAGAAKGVKTLFINSLASDDPWDNNEHPVEGTVDKVRLVTTTVPLDKTSDHARLTLLPHQFVVVSPKRATHAN